MGVAQATDRIQTLDVLDMLVDPQLGFFGDVIAVWPTSAWTGHQRHTVSETSGAGLQQSNRPVDLGSWKPAGQLISSSHAVSAVIYFVWLAASINSDAERRRKKRQNLVTTVMEGQVQRHGDMMG